MAKTTISILILFLAIVLAGTVYGEGATVFSNNKNVSSKNSGGKSIIFPDVAKTPTTPGPVPVPYPNTAKSSDTSNGAKKVKTDGSPIMLKDSDFTTTTGDESGTAGNSDADTPTIRPRRTYQDNW